MAGQYDENKHKRDKGKFAHQQGQKGGQPEKPVQVEKGNVVPTEKGRVGPSFEGGERIPDRPGSKPGLDPKKLAQARGDRDFVQKQMGQGKEQPDRGPMPEGAHQHFEAAHQASQAAMQAVESGNLASASAHGMALQNSIKAMKAAGVPTEQLTAMRKHLVNLSQAIKTGGHIEAHEAAAGLKHEAFKLRHGSLTAAQGTVDAGLPNQPDPAFRKSLDTLKGAGLLDKAGYDKKLGEHVLSRQEQQKTGDAPLGRVGAPDPTRPKGAGYTQPGSDEEARVLDEAANKGAAPYKTQGEKQREYEAFVKQKEGGKTEHALPPDQRTSTPVERRGAGGTRAGSDEEGRLLDAASNKRDKDAVHEEIEKHLQIAREGTSRSPASIKSSLQKASGSLSQHMEDISDDWAEHPDFNKASNLIAQADKHIESSKHYSAREALERAHQYVRSLQEGKKKFTAKSWDDAKAQADMLEMTFEEYIQLKAKPTPKDQ